MYMISKLCGVPCDKETGEKQFKQIKKEFENKSFWCFGFQHKAFLTLQHVRNGLYEGCYAVYQSATKPKYYIRIAEFK